MPFRLPERGSTMIERFTKSASRNIFYGGSAFFLILFVGLTAHSHFYIRNTSTDAAGLTESVARAVFSFMPMLATCGCVYVQPGMNL